MTILQALIIALLYWISQAKSGTVFQLCVCHYQ